MSALLDRLDAAEIFALASVDAISVEDARNQLQSHSAVDAMIEGIDQPFTNSIIAEGCATPRLFFKSTLARLPPTLGNVYFAAMMACDETPVRCKKLSPEGTLSVALVFCFRIRLYYAARRCRDVQPPIRLAPIYAAERLSVCYVPIPHRRSVAPAAAAAKSATDTSTSHAPHHTTTQQSQLSSSSAGSRPLIPIPSPHFSTPGSAFVVFNAPFSGGAPLSFVSPTREHASSDSSSLRTALPVSSLFAQPARNVTITPTSTAVTSPTPTTISSTIAPPSIAVAASVTTLASSSTSVSLPFAAPVAPSTTQSTVLTVTPVTADPNAQTSSTSVVTTASSSIRATSRRRKAEPHSRKTQPKRAAREEPTAVAQIVLDSSGKTHATVPMTENTAAASTNVSRIPNLLTAVKNELMSVRAARVATFAYVHSRSPTPLFNPLRISDSPATAENPTASSSESVGPPRVSTFYLPSETAVTGVSEYSGFTALLVQLAISDSRLREHPRLFFVCDDWQRSDRAQDGSWNAFRVVGVAYLVQ